MLYIYYIYIKMCINIQIEKIKHNHATKYETSLIALMIKHIYAYVGYSGVC